MYDALYYIRDIGIFVLSVNVYMILLTALCVVVLCVLAGS
jgi:hypothetical protein